MKSVFLCLFLAPFLSMAQSKLQQQVSPAGVIMGNRATATADGGYITVTKNEATVPFTLTAFKYSVVGTLQWKTTVTNGVSNWTFDLPFVTQTTSGDYIISVLEELGMDFIKLTASGKYVWDKTYRKGKGTVPSISTIADVKSNGKGSLFICGQYATFNKLEGFVSSLDEATGSLLWFKYTYSLVDGQGTKNDQDRFYALSVTADGGFIAAGITTQVKTFVNFTQYFSLSKYNTNGTREWAKAVAVDQPSSFSSTLVTDFEPTRSRNFILTGYNNFSQNCYFSVNDTGAVAYAKRIANSGDVYYPLARATYSPQAKKTYLLSSSNDGAQVNRVAINNSGDIQAAANSVFDSGFTKTNDDFITLKNGSMVATGYDNGNKLYMAQYPADKLACSEVPVTKLSTLSVPFTTYSLTVAEKSPLVSEFVTDSSNYSAVSEAFTNTTLCSSNTLTEMETMPVSSSLKGSNSNFVRLLQNPVSNIISLQVSATVNMPLQISVTSMAGQIVKTVKLQASAGVTNVTIPVADMQKGIYVVRVIGMYNQQSLKLVKL